MSRDWKSHTSECAAISGCRLTQQDVSGSHEYERQVEQGHQQETWAGGGGPTFNARASSYFSPSSGPRRLLCYTISSSGIPEPCVPSQHRASTHYKIVLLGPAAPVSQHARRTTALTAVRDRSRLIPPATLPGNSAISPRLALINLAPSRKLFPLRNKRRGQAKALKT